MRIIFFVLMAFAVSAVAQTPTEIRFFGEGNQLALNGDYKSALKNYEELLRGEVRSKAFLARVYFNSGVCRYQLNQYESAVEFLNQSIDLSNRKYQKAFYVLGMTEFAQNNLRSAESAFLESLKLNKRDGEAWFDLAFVYLEMNKTTDAQRAFSMSIKHKSSASAHAHNNLGVIYALRNDFQTAETEFRKALADPGEKSLEASANLEFCKRYKRSLPYRLVAEFNFSGSRTVTNFKI